MDRRGPICHTTSHVSQPGTVTAQSATRLVFKKTARRWDRSHKQEHWSASSPLNSIHRHCLNARGNYRIIETRPPGQNLSVQIVTTRPLEVSFPSVFAALGNSPPVVVLGTSLVRRISSLGIRARCRFDRVSSGHSLASPSDTVAMPRKLHPRIPWKTP